MTAPTLARPAQRTAQKPQPRNADRWPMASVLGSDITRGDRIGCIDGWAVQQVGKSSPGTCTDRFGAALGLCSCWSPLPSLPSMPMVELIGADGSGRWVYAHLRYAIAAHTTTQTGSRR